MLAEELSGGWSRSWLFQADFSAPPMFKGLGWDTIFPLLEEFASEEWLAILEGAVDDLDMGRYLNKAGRNGHIHDQR
ncbi:hypothetical protein AJ79_03498 [Helicocarpus griseus UAMH5409]|uniref:Uncharacterized protein n=1 Tax=Helicocarpus griseus UAMH5409 TaxID=1447875 RepID=A0A2B7XX99_9EURO|nr:hypothetical protein AJ79_03498 [Helicocarpus griseus UAMH5409]